jgi:hypothetical protein
MIELGVTQATAAVERSGVRPIPLGEIAPWALFVTVLALLAIYFVGAEQGAASIVPGIGIHEFVHDGRHLLGFPCH